MQKMMELKTCPLTGITIENDTIQSEMIEFKGIYYGLTYDNTPFHLGMSYTLIEMFQKIDNENLEDSVALKEEIKKLKEYIPIFLGELSKSNIKDLFNKAIHWDYQTIKQKHENYNIKAFVENIKVNGKYPKTKVEKLEMIFNKIKEEQNSDGKKIKMLGEFKYWSQFYMRNAKEFEEHLNILESTGFIKIENQNVSLTRKGINFESK